MHDILTWSEKRYDYEMDRNMRRGHDAAFKASVTLEALKVEKTMAQLSSEYGVYANQIRQWRQRPLDELHGVDSRISGISNPL